MSLTKAFDALTRRVWEEVDQGDAALGRQKHVLAELGINVDGGSASLEEQLQGLQGARKKARQEEKRARDLDDRVSRQEEELRSVKQQLRRELRTCKAAKDASAVAIEQLQLIRELVGCDPDMSMRADLEESFAIIDKTRMSLSMCNQGPNSSELLSKSLTNSPGFFSGAASPATAPESEGEGGAGHASSGEDSPASPPTVHYKESAMREAHEVLAQARAAMKKSRSTVPELPPPASPESDGRQTPMSPRTPNTDASAPASPVTPRTPTAPRSAPMTPKTPKSGGIRARKHMFEEHKLLLPKHCGHCNKSLGFHGKHIKCNQCLHIYHTTCVEKVPHNCQPAPFGSPAAKRRKAPRLGANLVMSLDDASKTGEVPSIVEACIEALERRAPHAEGIYRLSGQVSHVRKLKESYFDDAIPPINLMTVGDVHEVSGCLKLFFRELDEPLLTFHLYDQFNQAVVTEDPEMRFEMLAHVLKQMPPINFHTLHLLVRHLRKLAKAAATTKMTESNLALVFGPTLMQSPEAGNGTPGDMQGCQQVVLALLQMPTDLWSEAEEHVRGLDGSLDISPVPAKKAKKRKSRTPTSSC